MLLTTVVVGDALAQLGGAAMLAAALVVTRARLVRDGPTTGSLPLILPTRLGDRGAGLLAAGAF